MSLRGDEGEGKGGCKKKRKGGGRAFKSIWGKKERGRGARGNHKGGRTVKRGEKGEKKVSNEMFLTAPEKGKGKKNKTRC